jgi:hypothetical protein
MRRLAQRRTKNTPVKMRPRTTLAPRTPLKTPLNPRESYHRKSV